MVPVVSPFDAGTGELAQDRFARHVRYYGELGVAGYIVAGSSGEAALLDEEERARLVGWTRENADDRWVIAAPTIRNVWSDGDGSVLFGRAPARR